MKPHFDASYCWVKIRAAVLFSPIAILMIVQTAFAVPLDEWRPESSALRGQKEITRGDLPDEYQRLTIDELKQKMVELDELADLTSFFGDPAELVINEFLRFYIAAALGLSEEKIEAMWKAGQLYRDARIYDKAGLCFLTAHDIASALNDGRPLAAMLNAVGLMLDKEGKRDAAVSVLEDALAASKLEKDRRLEATVRYNLGYSCNSLGRILEAKEHFEQSVALRSELDTPQELSSAICALGAVHSQLGDRVRALELFETGYQLAAQNNDTEGMGTALNGFGEAYNVLGRREEALASYQRSLALARESGDRRGESVELNNIGMVYNNMGRFDEALKYYEDALKLCRQIDDRDGIWVERNNIAALYLKLGQPAAAEHYFSGQFHLVPPSAPGAQDAVLLHSVPELPMETFDWTRAHEINDVELTRAREAGSPIAELTALRNRGELFRRQGHYEEAAEAFSEAFKIAEFHSMLQAQALCKRSSADAQLSLGRYEAAFTSYLEALAYATAGLDIEEEGLIQYALGRIHEHFGRRPEAIACMRRALTLARARFCQFGWETGLQSEGSRQVHQRGARLAEYQFKSGLIEAGFETMQGTKASPLLGMLYQVHDAAPNEAARADWSDYLCAVGERRVLESQLYELPQITDLQQKSPAQGDPEEQAAWLDRMRDELSAQRQSLMQQIESCRQREARAIERLGTGAGQLQKLASYAVLPLSQLANGRAD